MRTKNIGDIKPGDFYYINRHSFVLALETGHTTITTEYMCLFHTNYHVKVFCELGVNNVTLDVL